MRDELDGQSERRQEQAPSVRHQSHKQSNQSHEMEARHDGLILMLRVILSIWILSDSGCNLYSFNAECAAVVNDSVGDL